MIKSYRDALCLLSLFNKTIFSEIITLICLFIYFFLNKNFQKYSEMKKLQVNLRVYNVFYIFVCKFQKSLTLSYLNTSDFYTENFEILNLNT